MMLLKCLARKADQPVDVVRSLTSDVEDFLKPYEPAQYLAYLIDLETKREPLAEEIREVRETFARCSPVRLRP